jgi:redox-sensing transcriptional repressor
VNERLSRRRLSTATIARFHTYSRVLERLINDGRRTVSSVQLGQLSATSAPLVRSDLFTLGFGGTRGVGYETDKLLARMVEVLGLERVREVVVVGAGRLGLAIASYLTQGARGLKITALYDTDPAKVGTEVAGVAIRSADRLAREALTDVVAVVATPAAAAQEVVDQLVTAGVRSILNFAPTGLAVPPDVTVRSVDLAGELYVLSFFQDHHDEPA